MKTLNGWQRLWVLVISIYLLLVSAFTWTTLPNESPLLQEWVFAILDIIKKSDSELSKADNWRIRNVLLKNGSSDEKFIRAIKAQINAKFAHHASELQAVYAMYEVRIDNLHKERLKYIGTAFLIWAIPSCLLYILGISVGWIYRGFKDPPNNENKSKQEQDMNTRQPVKKIFFRCLNCQSK